MGKNEYYLKQIGARIMECRKEKGYQNREEFAKLLGISSNTLRNYENGVREIGTELLLRISMLLGVSTDRLLCKDEKSASTEIAFHFPQTSLFAFYFLFTKILPF